jgi:peptide/nickel transport system permease protein
MSSYVARRLLQAVPILLGVTVLTFAVLAAAPGDPVLLLVAPEQQSAADLAALRAQLGLTKPLPVQYAAMMENLVTGRLRSFRARQPVTALIAGALGPTALLAGLALAVAALLSLPIALVSALRPYTALDHAVTMFSLLGIALPSFWFALILVFVFTDRLTWLPASGLRPEGVAGYPPSLIWPYLVMPTIVLALSILPLLVRYARSALLETLHEEYVLVARAKGLTGARVLEHHVLRNSLVPVVTVLGLLIPSLLSGVLVVETIFAIPGVGRLAVDGALARDYPVVMTTTVVGAALVIVSNLLTDVSYALLDPRIRFD